MLMEPDAEVCPLRVIGPISFVYVDYTFRAYYSIISEILSIDITGEQIEGIKLIVTNDIGPMTLNGQTSASGSISITF